MQLVNVKSAMAYKQPMRYMDIDFNYISGCTLRIRDGEWYYQLELAGRSGVVIADIKDVEVKHDVN